MKTLVILVALVALAPAGAALLTDPIQNDAGTGRDAGDSEADATTLRNYEGGYAHASGSYTGMMVFLDDPNDVYKFVAPAGTDITVTVTVTGTSQTCAAAPNVTLGAVTATLRDPQGATVALASATGPCGSKLSLNAPAEPVQGTWHIALSYANRVSPVGPPLASGFDGEGLSAVASYDLALGCRPWC